MQAHWDYPAGPSGDDRPWGFLRSERETILSSPFMKPLPIDPQPYQALEVAVNDPALGAAPRAAFDVALLGFEATFTNQTEDASLYLWTFGDDQSSVEEEPTHRYAASATYPIRLYASSSTGMMDISTTTVAVPNHVYGLAVNIAADELTGYPGESTDYQLTVTNTGSISDVFRLEATGNRWLFEGPDTIGPIAPRADTTLQLRHWIPEDALADDADAITLTVASTHDQAISETVALRTVASAVHRLTVMPLNQSGENQPGLPVNYELQITNTGNVTDIYTITLQGYEWPTTGPLETGPTPAQQATSVTLTVEIPTTAVFGAVDTCIVAVTSRTDPTAAATAALETAAKPQTMFLPLIVDQSSGQ
jgi:PKD repeat protein